MQTSLKIICSILMLANSLLGGEASLDHKKIGVLYVQFADWETNYKARGSVKKSDLSQFYSYDDYYKQIFSVNEYRSKDIFSLRPQNLSADNRIIYGSVRDYWRQNSYGKWDFAAGSNIINPAVNANGQQRLQWLTLPFSKNQSPRSSDLYQTAIALAKENHWIEKESDFDVYALVYAGARGKIRNLWPNSTLMGKYFICEERRDDFSDQYRQLAGIYTFCHEMGHAVFGLHDLRGGRNNRGLGVFDLMSEWVNTDAIIDDVYECPPHLSCYHKIKLGWLEPTQVIENLVQQKIPNIEQNPFVLKFDINDNEYFLIANRQPVGFDIQFQDTVKNLGGGLLVYHGGRKRFPNGERVRIIEADGEFELYGRKNSGEQSDFFRPGGFLSDHSNPDCRSQAGQPTHFGMFNIHAAKGMVSADFYVNCLTGEIFRDTTLVSGAFVHGSLKIREGTTLIAHDNIHISENGSLIMEDNTKICFSENSALIAEGNLIVEGDVVFSGLKGKSWPGIRSRSKITNKGLQLKDVSFWSKIRSLLNL